MDCELPIHKIALLAHHIKADRGACWGVAAAREVHLLDVERKKPPEQVRGAAVSARSGRIQAFQPEEELPLQTRCRCSGPSCNRQPQVVAVRASITATLSRVCGSAGASVGYPPREILRRRFHSAKPWRIGRCRCAGRARRCDGLVEHRGRCRNWGERMRRVRGPLGVRHAVHFPTDGLRLVALRWMGDVRRRRGEGRVGYDRLRSRSGAVLGLSEGAALWARYHRQTGDIERANDDAQQALIHATEPRQPLALLAAHRLLGELDTAAGRFDDARAHLITALALADAGYEGLDQGLVTVEELVGRMEQAGGDEAGGEVEGTSGSTLTRGPLNKGDARKEKQVKEGQG